MVEIQSGVGINKIPRLSVIMAVHNGQAFLEEAVSSVLKQSFQDFEFIVVDDASTDATPAILQQVGDRRLRVITLSSNAGLADALNHSLPLVQGALVARMDADDVAYPHRFAAQVARMENDPELVLLGTSFNFIDEQGRTLLHRALSTDNETLQRRLVEDCNQFCHPSVMLRADAVRKVGGYRETAGRFAQDYDLWLRLAEVGTIANLPDVFLGYRVHKGQASVGKLHAQRRAAELYKIFARQRRQFGFEDFSAAESEISGLHRSLRLAVANDCLFWSELFARMGNHAQALKMQGQALWSAPLSGVVYAGIRKYAAAALRGGGSP